MTLIVDPTIFNLTKIENSSYECTKKHLFQAKNLLDFLIDKRIRVFFTSFLYQEFADMVKRSVVATDPQINQAILTLQKKLRTMIISNAEISDNSLNCLVEINYIDKIPKEYERFFDLLLAECKTSTFMIKNEASCIFSSSQFEVLCDISCELPTPNIFRTLTVDEYIPEYYESEIENKFFAQAFHKRIHVSIPAEENKQHHKLFSQRRINSFSDIPSAEKEFFEVLDRVLHISRIQFRGRYRFTGKTPLSISNIRQIKKSSVDVSFVCQLSLASSSDYKECDVQLVADINKFDLFYNFLEKRKLTTICLQELTNLLPEQH